jgi:16S rRNA (adenine1518-N6/adenine1519-N6)-dimethyltransferase
VAHPSPRALLERHGLRAKKSWGQNFLGDEAILDGIARLAVERPGEVVIELGSGLGHLTERLLAHGARVVAVERDRDMARVLRAEFGNAVRVEEADAARADLARVAALAPGGAQEGRVAVAGNIPYHLTSPILFSLLDQGDAVSRAVLLVQREVAERLAAAPGTKDWGLLSVLLQQRGGVEIDRIVPRGAFHPPPRVESAVVRIDLHGRAPRAADPARFRLLVKAGFAQRRKTLRNALEASRIAPREVLEEALRRAGIDPGRRGETLTVDEWEALDHALPPVGPPGAAASRERPARP